MADEKIPYYDDGTRDLRVPLQDCLTLIATDYDLARDMSRYDAAVAMAETAKRSR
jgi:hypothetical protein